jgi:hypothetical protein
MKPLSHALLGLVVATCSAACSSSPEGQAHAEPEPVQIRARIAVRIAPGAASFPVNTRAALVWELAFVFRDDHVENQTGYRRIIGADAPLAADGSGVLELTDVPPTYQPHDMAFVNSNIELAEGLVVAYEDLNGNQSLDLQRYDTQAYVDRIVAYNQDLRIVYAEGLGDDGPSSALKRHYGVQVGNGFGVHYLERDAASPSPLGSSPAYESVESFGKLGYAFELAPAPVLSGGANPLDVDRSMCEEKPLGPREYFTGVLYWSGRPVAYPGSERGERITREVTCAEDGSWLEARQCTGLVAPEPCHFLSKHCSSDVWRRPNPVPSDWPCP